jgi:hypothetical protein
LEKSVRQGLRLRSTEPYLFELSLGSPPRGIRCEERVGANERRTKRRKPTGQAKTSDRRRPPRSDRGGFAVLLRRSYQSALRRRRQRHVEL